MVVESTRVVTICTNAGPALETQVRALPWALLHGRAATRLPIIQCPSPGGRRGPARPRCSDTQAGALPDHHRQ